jgi:hypothetical protein
MSATVYRLPIVAFELKSNALHNFIRGEVYSRETGGQMMGDYVPLLRIDKNSCYARRVAIQKLH